MLPYFEGLHITALQKTRMEGEGSPLANIPHPALATTQSFDLPKLFESRSYLYFKGQRGAGGPFAHSAHPAFATASSADAKKSAPHTCCTNFELRNF